MDLFLILYVGAKIGGFGGPLPYDEAECRARAAALQEDVNTVVTTGRATNGRNTEVPAGDLEEMKTWAFRCEFRAERPKIEVE